MFKRPDSRFFREEYVERSREFFDRYGARTIVTTCPHCFNPLADGTDYMRNAVKVVIDAYDGDVAAYLATPDDPIVRTLAPVMAGVSKMNYRTFVLFNVIGGIAWGVSITTLGYFLGQVEFVHDNLEPIILGIVALSVLPIVLELWRARRHR